VFKIVFKMRRKGDKGPSETRSLYRKINHIAKLQLSSKQGVAGSNPAGRTKFFSKLELERRAQKRRIGFRDGKL